MREERYWEFGNNGSTWAVLGALTMKVKALSLDFMTISMVTQSRQYKKREYIYYFYLLAFIFQTNFMENCLRLT